MAVLIVQALLLFSAVALAATFIGGFRSDSSVFAPRPVALAIGAIVNFFDTLGIGSFAPTTAAIKALGLTSDERIPGTLNVGHALPTIAQALIFIALIKVDLALLLACIGAAVAGAVIGARAVARLPVRAIRLGMGAALIVAAGLFSMRNLGWMPGGGAALSLAGPAFAAAVLLHAAFGALMTIGVGLYAPSLIALSLLGMDPRGAFPIMMGACAFLMPAASLAFIRSGRLEPRLAFSFAIAGVPAVLVAAFIVKEMPLDALRWLVAGVVLVSGAMMLASAARRDATKEPAQQHAAFAPARPFGDDDDIA